MYLNGTEKKPKGRKAMIDYLRGHCRYHTMNSWNNSTSYANCIKVDRLGLDHDMVLAALDMLNVSEACEEFSEILLEFDIRHERRWQICQNGRTGGYLVLIQGGKGEDGQVFTWPGKSLDMNAEFHDWSLDDLSSRMDLVWDFDEACETAVAAFIDFTRTYNVEVQEVLIARKVKVAVPKVKTASPR